MPRVYYGIYSGDPEVNKAAGREIKLEAHRSETVKITLRTAARAMPPGAKADGGGTARAATKKASDRKASLSARGSDSARTLNGSKKAKGLSLAVGKIPTLQEMDEAASMRADKESERANELEQQMELQRSQFEQQMQQSAIAMEELFDQLAAMRREKDVAVVALQKALASQQGMRGAYHGTASTEPGRAVEELQIENAQLREDNEVLKGENAKLQSVVAGIKQLILNEPSALAARMPLSTINASPPNSPDPSSSPLRDLPSQLQLPLPALVAGTAVVASPTIEASTSVLPAESAHVRSDTDPTAMIEELPAIRCRLTIGDGNRVVVSVRIGMDAAAAAEELPDIRCRLTVDDGNRMVVSFAYEDDMSSAS